jgi:hypothetical protein
VQEILTESDEDIEYEGESDEDNGNPSYLEEEDDSEDY